MAAEQSNAFAHEPFAANVDLELVGNCSRRPPAEDVARELDAFVATVEARWQRPVLIYTDDDWDGRYPTVGRLGRDLWTRYPLRPSRRWTIWQLSLAVTTGDVVPGWMVWVVR